MSEKQDRQAGADQIDPEITEQMIAAIADEIPLPALVAAVGAMSAYADKDGNISPDCLVEAFKDGFRAAMQALSWSRRWPS